MYIVFLGLTVLMAVWLFSSLVQSSLNKTRSKLNEAGLPMTFKNVFFLRSIEYDNASREMEEEQIASEALISKELVGRRIYEEIVGLVSQGHDWRDATREVLLREPQNVEEAVQEMRRKRLKETSLQ